MTAEAARNAVETEELDEELQQLCGKVDTRAGTCSVLRRTASTVTNV